jgi:hypothetical protein
MKRGLHKAGGSCLLALASALALPAWSAQAQSPTAAAPAMPEKIYTKSNTFDLPILMKKDTQQTLRKVCLWVKAPGANWCQVDETAPTSSKFSFRATQDGEYWFNLVTVDSQGRSTPADVTTAPPGLRVVVDTKAPVIEVQPTPAATDGDCTLRCAVIDANPNHTSLRVVARLSTGDVTLDGVVGQAGVFRVRPELQGSSIRITASDMAGNTAVRELNLKELLPVATSTPSTPVAPMTPPATTTPAAPPASLPSGVPGAASNLAAPKSTAQEPSAPVAPPTLTPVQAIEKATPTPVAPALPVAAPPAAPTQVAPSIPVAPSTPVAPVSTATTPVSTPTTAVTTTTTARMPSLATEVPHIAGKGSTNRQILNTTHAAIDYRIDHQGPSGIGKVEIYLTHDEGKNWRRVAEDIDRTTPAEIDLPGEGLFGVRLAITNGAGFGGTPPAHGDAPQYWVEVDLTPPYVQMRTPEIVHQANAIDIHWNASDPNLGNEPVSLFYRVRPDAPWQMIARGLKNEGKHRWTFPRDAGTQFFFKVEVADMAGNIGRAETQAPLMLDMTEPRASVIGVTGMNKGN